MKVIITNIITREEKSGYVFAPEAYPLKEMDDDEVYARKEQVIEQIVFSVYKMAFPSKF